MAVPFFLIDGYNVLHAAGLARPTYGPGDLERARHRLLRLLVNYLSDREISRARVLFDAFDAPAGLSRHSSFEGLQISFAETGSDADSLIEDLIQSHSAPRQIIVVSSDRRLQKAAHRRRAKSIDSAAFLDEILHRTPRGDEDDFIPDPNPKYEGQLSSGELAEWMKLFSGVEEVVRTEEAATDRVRKTQDLPPVPVPTALPAETDLDIDLDEWSDLLDELGLSEEHSVTKFSRSEDLAQLQDEINRLVTDEGGWDL
ncbi:MAG TPA: NYN domain-containing protein [Planctomycetaceae bacterium]|nr:NYN domain-containing protein [Planctomycetaceae bacterium]